jgi:hypothetical protein
VNSDSGYRDKILYGKACQIVRGRGNISLGDLDHRVQKVLHILVWKVSDCTPIKNLWAIHAEQFITLQGIGVQTRIFIVGFKTLTVVGIYVVLGVFLVMKMLTSVLTTSRTTT